jgi:O-antigen/teichoic acid export membrane protein
MIIKTFYSNIISNTAYYLTGSASVALAQFLIVLSLARFGDTTILGQYSLALSICSPLFLFSECKLREVMASDASGRFAEHEYFIFRILTASLLLGCFVLVGILLNCFTYLGAVIAAVGVWKAFDSIADIGYGWYQRRRRMREICIAMTLRSIGAVGSIIIGLSILEDLKAGILLAAAVSGLILLRYDLRSIHLNVQTTQHVDSWVKWPGVERLLALFTTVVPLGFVAGLTSLRIAVPRYYIVRNLDESELGFFTAAYALPALGTLLVTSFGQTLLPHVADIYQKKRGSLYSSLVRSLMGVSAIGLVGVLVAVFFGADLLQLIYGPDYRKVYFELVGLSVATGLTFGCSIVGVYLTAVGIFRAQVLIYVFVVALITLSSALLVPVYGLLGAVYAMILSASIWLVLSIEILRRWMRKQLLHQRS